MLGAATEKAHLPRFSLVLVCYPYNRWYVGLCDWLIQCKMSKCLFVL